MLQSVLPRNQEPHGTCRPARRKNESPPKWPTRKLARAAWPVAAGKKIARHARATALVRGTLCRGGRRDLQRQLATLRHFLLRNLARELGQSIVSEIDFRPTPARRPPQPAASARPNRRTPTASKICARLLYRRSQGMHEDHEQEIRRVAELANLALTDDEVAQMARD